MVNFDGDAYVTDEKNRGRQETRYHIISELTDEFQELSYEWPGLKTVDVVMSFRQEGDEAPEVPMIRYYISSGELSAKKLAEASRHHWFVENKLHWSLDVALREDACKINRGQAAETSPDSEILRLIISKVRRVSKAKFVVNRRKRRWMRRTLSTFLRCRIFMLFPWLVKGQNMIVLPHRYTGLLL